MSDVETAAPAPDEASALSAARAGYAKATGSAPPAAASTTQDTAASGDDLSAGANGAPATTQSETGTDSTAQPAAAPAAAPAQPAIHDELASLKQRVAELQTTGGASAQEVRRLQGEIGNLNRAIKTFEQAKGTAADDQLAAALKRAEDMAKEFPEIATPMVEALKLLSQRQAAQPAAEAPAPAAPSQPQGPTSEQQLAIRAIDEAHPDRHQVTTSTEFKTWIAAQPPEYQQLVASTWNPAVLSGCLTKFKEHAAAEKARAVAKAAEVQRKTDRLTAAASPQGVPAKGQPSTLPDEAGYSRGYARKRRL
jgi:hypothetical protein